MAGVVAIESRRLLAHPYDDSVNPGHVTLGILSDAHGEWTRARMAIERLQSRGASMFLYAGDACDLKVIDQLAGLDSFAVAGNCDRHLWKCLPDYCRAIGVTYGEVSIELCVDGRRVLLTHSDPRCADDIAAAERAGVEYIVRGHDHVEASWEVRGSAGRNAGSCAAGNSVTRHLCAGSVAESRDGDGVCRALLLTPATGEAEWIRVG